MAWLIDSWRYLYIYIYIYIQYIIYHGDGRERCKKTSIKKASYIVVVISTYIKKALLVLGRTAYLDFIHGKLSKIMICTHILKLTFKYCHVIITLLYSILEFQVVYVH